MGSNQIKVQFSVRKESKVPKVGHRKTMRVNGRVETLYVSQVDVEISRVELYDDDGKFLGMHREFSGTATFIPFGSIRTVAE